VSDEAIVGVGGIFFVLCGVVSIAFRSSISPWFVDQAKDWRFGPLWDWTRFVAFWGVLAIVFGAGAFLTWMVSL
jgi:hypothetical protein